MNDSGKLRYANVVEAYIDPSSSTDKCYQDVKLAYTPNGTPYSDIRRWKDHDFYRIDMLNKTYDTSCPLLNGDYCFPQLTSSSTIQSGTTELGGKVYYSETDDYTSCRYTYCFENGNLVYIIKDSAEGSGYSINKISKLQRVQDVIDLDDWSNYLPEDFPEEYTKGEIPYTNDSPKYYN